jgi:hypothetical protein
VAPAGQAARPHRRRTTTAVYRAGAILGLVAALLHPAAAAQPPPPQLPPCSDLLDGLSDNNTQLVDRYNLKVYTWKQSGLNFTQASASCEAATFPGVPGRGYLVCYNGWAASPPPPAACCIPWGQLSPTPRAPRPTARRWRCCCARRLGALNGCHPSPSMPPLQLR